MATRFYLPDSGAAAVSPAFTATWEKTTGADRIRTSTNRIGSAMAVSNRAGNGANPSDVLARQYVSDPLFAAVSISGTVKGMIKVAEVANTNNYVPGFIMTVVDSSNALRGTLLTALATGTEFATSQQSRKFPGAWSSPGTAITTVSALVGDRIVIEIGYTQTSTATANGGFTFGDDSASDLGESENETNTFNPWIELSASLSFVAPPSPKLRLQAVARAAGR